MSLIIVHVKSNVKELFKNILKTELTIGAFVFKISKIKEVRELDPQSIQPLNSEIVTYEITTTDAAIWHTTEQRYSCQQETTSFFKGLALGLEVAMSADRDEIASGRFGRIAQ